MLNTLAHLLIPSLALLCIGHVLPAQSSLELSLLPDRDAGDDYSVYSALVKNTVWLRDSSKALILDHTNDGLANVSCLKKPDGEPAERYGEQIRSVIERNKVFYRLVARFDIGRSYELVNAAPTLATGRSAAHVSVSAVGFNAARNRAVVFMAYGGMGGAHVLTKNRGTWTVDLQRMPWVCGWIN